MSSEGEVFKKSEPMVLPRARIFLKLTEKREVSYKDLYETFLKENGVQESSGSSDESESQQYSYPAFMQRIIERLDKYGQLALREQIGIHKSDPRKKRKTSEEVEETKENTEEKLYDGPEESASDSENSCELYYDLSDNFIDDSDLQQNGNNEENDFQKALNEGFYTMNIEEYQKSIPKTPKKQKKPKEKKETPKVEFQRKLDTDITHLSNEIKEKFEELKKLYETKRKEGNTAPFPKGSAPILEKIVVMVDNGSADFESLFNNISLCSGQPVENVKSQFEKIRKKIGKHQAQSGYNKLMRQFKRKLANSDYKWNKDNHAEFLKILEALGRYVNVFNAALASRGGKKNKPLLSYNDEEAKVILELKKLSNTKLDNVNLKAEVVDLNIGGVLNPRISERFDCPEFNEEDFERIV
ncbi:hypothetical protein SteCoe_10278 [Stentor coeruleus]|uniref:Uncharacterized protein n=1 Tax=Stentor coeruleus TaxID=5963 RepID=A0A1R2CG82_9CILI|nr:hypothetical protein SteCoe_10278 [Stentor coeruleus]